MIFATLLLAAIPACGPSSPAQSPEAAKETPSAEPEASKEAPSAASSAPEASKPKAAPEAEGSPVEGLARDLLKAGGRRIGWSASKKRFVVPVDFRTDGGRGLDLRFYDDDGAQREVMRVCQPGECEERLDEMVKDLLPKLSARLDKEGFESVASVGWPSGRDEIDVGTLQAKLRQDKGKLSIVREKKTTPLRGSRSGKGDVTAVYPVPAAKLLGVIAGDFFVVKLP
jgi:hypothetical protein